MTGTSREVAEVLSLGVDEAARLALAAQHLTEPVPSGSVDGLAGHLAGIQAQLVTSPGLAAFHRLKGYAPGDLERELEPGGSLTRIWCMRGTLHVVPSRDAGTFLSATAPAWFERHGRHVERREPFVAREPLRQAVLEALAGGPRTREELAPCFSRFPSPLTPYGVLKELNYLGLAVPLGSDDARPRHALAVQVLPGPGPVARDASAPAAVAARDELCRRYFRAYGPATLADFACWAGLTVAEARESLARLGGELQEVRLAGSRAPAYLQAQAGAPGGEPPTALLGPFEPLVLGYRDRSRFLDPEHRHQVVGPTGFVAPVVLHGGRIVATWKAARRARGMSVAIEQFAPLGRKVQEAVAAAAAKLAAYYNTPLGAVTWE